MTDKTKKTRLSKFNFEEEGCAVALVGDFQGGPANGYTTLVTKSTCDIQKASEEEILKAVNVNLKLSLMEFLTRYVGIWYDDAEMIAGMLGYTYDDLYSEDEIGSYEDMVKENMNKVTIEKSESSQRFVDAFNEYLTKSSSSVEEGGENSGNKSTEESINKTNDREDFNMSVENTEVTQENLQEMIQKAASALIEEQREEIQKAADAQVAEVRKELDVLKATEAAREKQEFMTKAEGYASYLGEDVDREELASALAFVEKSEDGAAVMQVLKALKTALDQGDEFVEKGVSATQDQPTDNESKVIALQKSLIENDGMSEQDAYVKAFEKVHGVS